MSKIDLDYINMQFFKYNEKPLTLEDVEYKEIKHNGNKLVDDDGNEIGTKGDFYTKLIIEKILTEGTWDENPRPVYETDGRPAHTLSLNNEVFWKYDLTKGESPLITLRPIAIEQSVGEVLWIFKDQTTDLDILKEKYGVKWWDLWEYIDENGKHTRSLGNTYGVTIDEYDQTDNLIDGIIKEPFSRRHMIDMWQLEVLRKPNSLLPCAYSNVWNVKKDRDGKYYLDMKLIQRSSDFMVAGCLNQMQYLAFHYMIARATNFTPGTFTWDVENIQIYDRHIPQAIEFLNRDPINSDDNKEPYIELNNEKNNFYDFMPQDIKIKNYPREKIKKLNPQQTFDKGV